MEFDVKLRRPRTLPAATANRLRGKGFAPPTATCPHCNSVIEGDVVEHVMGGACRSVGAEARQQLQAALELDAARNDSQEKTCVCCGRFAPTRGLARFVTLWSCGHDVCGSCFDALQSSDVAPCCPLQTCCRPLTTAECGLLRPAAQELSPIDTGAIADANPECTFVTCPGCGVMMEHLKRSNAGSANTPRSHFNEFRLRCRNCDVCFCVECRMAPYHGGHTCESYRRSLTLQSCRFCGAEVDGAASARGGGPVRFFDRVFRSRRQPPVDCCNDDACVVRSATVCNKVLPCGHPCYLAPDAECGPCFVEGCSASQPTASTRHMVVCRDDFCNVCYVDELRAGACVPLSCGHVFHLQCLEARLRARWGGNRVGFNYMQCPLCHAEVIDGVNGTLTHAPASLLEMLREHWTFREAVEVKMLSRLKLEGLDNDPSLSDPASEFFKQPLKFASKTLAYYSCSRCHRAFFGGLQRCEALLPPDDVNAASDDTLCPGCLPAAQRHVCPAHGTDYMEFKCKFCCSVATFYCWGKTHFCSACHKRQDRGEYLTRMPVSAHPSCDGKETCPLGVDHPPNGECEFALGCSLCRDDLSVRRQRPAPTLGVDEPA